MFRSKRGWLLLLPTLAMVTLSSCGSAYDGDMHSACGYYDDALAAAHAGDAKGYWSSLDRVRGELAPAGEEAAGDAIRVRMASNLGRGGSQLYAQRTSLHGDNTIPSTPSNQLMTQTCRRF